MLFLYFLYYIQKTSYILGYIMHIVGMVDVFEYGVLGHSIIDYLHGGNIGIV